jgi:hypothetical protein
MGKREVGVRDFKKRISATNEHEYSRIGAEEKETNEPSKSRKRFVFICVHSWLISFWI